MSKNATASNNRSKTFTSPDVTSQIFQRFADVPGVAGSTPVPCTGSTGQTGNCGGSLIAPPASTDTHSPAGTDGANSPNGIELAPQLLGSSGVIALGKNSNITTLTFNDWPATIAINHVRFKVPEPGSLVLLGIWPPGLGHLAPEEVGLGLRRGNPSRIIELCPYLGRENGCAGAAKVGRSNLMRAKRG